MLNKVLIIGRIVADPELRQTPTNVAVTSFTVAVNRPFVKGTERQADFIDVVAWRNTAEFVCKYFQKGKPIMVEGRLQVRSYTDKSGNKRKAVEVVADNVSFVEGTSRQGTAEAPESLPVQDDAPAAAFSSGDSGDFEEVEGFDDLPF